MHIIIMHVIDESVVLDTKKELIVFISGEWIRFGMGKTYWPYMGSREHVVCVNELVKKRVRRHGNRWNVILGSE